MPVIQIRPKLVILLGVNVDHVATVRNASGGSYPDPVFAGLQAELAGADFIRMQLSADRRHIQDHDVERFAASTQTHLALEFTLDEQIRDVALRVRPTGVCLVPEDIAHRDTLGGFDVIGNQDALSDFLPSLQEAGIRDLLLVSPDEAQIEAAARAGSAGIELNARAYAASTDTATRSAELSKIMSACDFAYSLGLSVAVGRGLQFDNVQAVAEIATIEELTIGHAIIARALYFGLPEAVAEMKRRLAEARQRR